MQDMAMIGMNDNRDAGEPCSEAPDEARFGCMGVNDVRPLSPHQSVEGHQCPQVARLERRLGDDLGDNHWPDAALHGKVQYRPFPGILCASHQDRLEACRIQAGIQIDHVNRWTTNIEPRDHPNDLYFARTSLDELKV